MLTTKREWPFLVDLWVNDQGEEHYIALGPDFPGELFLVVLLVIFLKLVCINLSEDLLRCMK